MAEFTEQEKQDLLKAAREVGRALDESMRADDEKNLEGGSGSNDLEFERVKAGRVLVIENLSGYNNTSGSTRIRIGYKQLDSYTWKKVLPAPLATETAELLGPLRLREGMMPVVRFEGCQSGDDLYATLNGYWIDK